ncbi:fanconi anemia group m protein [Anaeramoeba flamelloides]|uniref:Fanconi anemia group m protein n=1 Tax=Anaeramoeba flamelloides TaxID=1746091 RepID=A0AAV7ZB27_9EUKA|nr:fanconi anemia group m protein [Anaeramoeba flamelloides]
MYSPIGYQTQTLQNSFQNCLSVKNYGFQTALSMKNSSIATPRSKTSKHPIADCSNQISQKESFTKPYLTSPHTPPNNKVHCNISQLTTTTMTPQNCSKQQTQSLHHNLDCSIKQPQQNPSSQLLHPNMNNLQQSQNLNDQQITQFNTNQKETNQLHKQQEQQQNKVQTNSSNQLSNTHFLSPVNNNNYNPKHQLFLTPQPKQFPPNNFSLAQKTQFFTPPRTIPKSSTFQQNRFSTKNFQQQQQQQQQLPQQQLQTQPKLFSNLFNSSPHVNTIPKQFINYQQPRQQFQQQNRYNQQPQYQSFQQQRFQNRSQRKYPVTNIFPPKLGSYKDKNLPKIDQEKAQTWIYPTNEKFEMREYQLNISKTALFNNTLVVLPTGLGKTFIAAVIMYNFYRWFPTGKIIFMAPTKPLVEQQLSAVSETVNISKEDSCVVTGKIVSKKRQILWDNKRVFYGTPQTIYNDLRNDRCHASQIVCLVIDEAHKASGNYDYTKVVRHLLLHTDQFRVLGLTATPGERRQQIQHVIGNLLIAKLEFRSDENNSLNPDNVTQYLKSREIVELTISLRKSKAIREIRSLFKPFLRECLLDLYSKNLFKVRDPERVSSGALVMANLEFSKKRRNLCGQGNSNDEYNRCKDQLLLGISLFYGYERLKQYGIIPFYKYLDQKFVKCSTETKISTNSSIEKFRTSANFQKLTKKLAELIKNKNEIHPKLSKLKSIVADHFSNNVNKDTRVMIFSIFRDSVSDITQALLNVPNVKAMPFVGQSSRGSQKGYSQKHQKLILNAFKNGGYNTLVATCIGEEGLDIGEVDLIICYDVPSDPRRSIQRYGRTGRKRNGKVVVLLTEGLERNKYFKKKRARKSNFQTIINQSNYIFYDQNPRIIPINVNPQLRKENISKSKKEKSHAQTPKNYLNFNNFIYNVDNDNTISNNVEKNNINCNNNIIINNKINNNYNYITNINNYSNNNNNNNNNNEIITIVDNDDINESITIPSKRKKQLRKKKKENFLLQINQENLNNNFKVNQNEQLPQLSLTKYIKKQKDMCSTFSVGNSTKTKIMCSIVNDSPNDKNQSNNENGIITIIEEEEKIDIKKKKKRKKKKSRKTKRKRKTKTKGKRKGKRKERTKIKKKNKHIDLNSFLYSTNPEENLFEIKNPSDPIQTNHSNNIFSDKFKNTKIKNHLNNNKKEKKMNNPNSSQKNTNNSLKPQTKNDLMKIQNKNQKTDLTDDFGFCDFDDEFFDVFEDFEKMENKEEINSPLKKINTEINNNLLNQKTKSEVIFSQKKEKQPKKKIKNNLQQKKKHDISKYIVTRKQQSTDFQNNFLFPTSNQNNIEKSITSFRDLMKLDPDYKPNNSFITQKSNILVNQKQQQQQKQNQQLPLLSQPFQKNNQKLFQSKYQSFRQTQPNNFNNNCSQINFNRQRQRIQKQFSQSQIIHK